jgi:hypothetical protein
VKIQPEAVVTVRNVAVVTPAGHRAEAIRGRAGVRRCRVARAETTPDTGHPAVPGLAPGP